MKDAEIIYTTNANWVGAIHGALQEAGLDASELFKKFDIPLDVLDQLEKTRVDVTKIKSLWRHVTNITGNDAISLQVPHHMKINASILTLLGSTSENMQSAATIMAKYLSASSTAIQLLISTTDTLNIEIKPTATGFYIGEEAMDAAMARITQLTSMITTPAIKPFRIELQREPPKCLGVFESVFNCPLLFEQERNCIIFSMEDALHPFKTHNVALAFHMEEYLKGYIEKQLPKDTTNPLVKNIFHHLGYMLPEGKPNISSMAKRLNMSPRTLQRKLKEHNFSFQELLDKFRLDLASHYLKQGEHSVEAISDLLGFGSYTSFIRFFKVATSLTPKEFIRQQHDSSK